MIFHPFLFILNDKKISKLCKIFHKNIILNISKLSAFIAKNKIIVKNSKFKLSILKKCYYQTNRHWSPPPHGYILSVN